MCMVPSGIMLWPSWELYTTASSLKVDTALLSSPTDFVNISSLSNCSSEDM